jgi:phenol 2-monooxygenase (NADPH)
VTLHQQAIETIISDNMNKFGVTVDRPMHPTSLEVSEDEQQLKDPNAYPVKVSSLSF